MSNRTVYNERVIDSLLPRKWQKIDSFAEHCDRENVEQIEAGIETRITGSGPEATQRFRPIYRAESDNETIEYQGRETRQTWDIEFSKEPSNLYEIAKEGSYDAWPRFTEDREFLEEEYGFETESFFP